MFNGRRVVVTGMGALTPIGNNLSDYWTGLSKGVSGAAPITYFNTENFKTKFACELKDFNINDLIPRSETRRLDQFAQYAQVVADEAVADSGILDMPTLDKDMVGVIFGSGIGGFNTLQDELVNLAENNKKPRFNPFFIPKLIIDIAAGVISIKYGFRGPNFSTVSACATSSHAIMDAYMYICAGKADAILTGGSEAVINETGVGGFNAMHALSTRNDSPETASRPFDKTRDGFVLGEGGGALVLEEYEHAKKRGAKIYSELVGIGLSADAYHITAPHPEGLGVVKVMKDTLKHAKLNTSQIDCINVHGTSTPLGDIAELSAIQKVYKEDAYNINIVSTKSMTGHLLGAAGAVEAIASIMSMQHNIVPPTINHQVEDDKISSKLNLTLNKAQEREINCIMSNTFGFGGHNACLLFKRI